MYIYYIYIFLVSYLGEINLCNLYLGESNLRSQSARPTLTPLGHGKCGTNAHTTRPLGVWDQRSYNSATGSVGPTLIPPGHGEG